jgi:hypothetical protein
MLNLLGRVLITMTSYLSLQEQLRCVLMPHPSHWQRLDGTRIVCVTVGEHITAMHLFMRGKVQPCDNATEAFTANGRGKQHEHASSIGVG